MDDSDNISLYHASFREFLEDPLRSQEFCINTPHLRMALARSVLKALSYMCDELPPDQVRSSSDHVAWCVPIFPTVVAYHSQIIFIDRRLGRPGIAYLTSIPPSADLLPLIRSVNPEFLWRGLNKDVRKMIHWLKASPKTPVQIVSILMSLIEN